VVLVMAMEGMPKAAVKRAAQVTDEVVAAEARRGVTMEVVATVGQGGDADARGGQTAREAAAAVAQVSPTRIAQRA